jgi:hypothetical protein
MDGLPEIVQPYWLFKDIREKQVMELAEQRSQKIALYEEILKDKYPDEPEPGSMINQEEAESQREEEENQEDEDEENQE